MLTKTLKCLQPEQNVPSMIGGGSLYLRVANTEQLYIKYCRMAKHRAENLQT